MRWRSRPHPSLGRGRDGEIVADQGRWGPIPVGDWGRAAGSGVWYHRSGGGGLRTPCAPFQSLSTSKIVFTSKKG